MSIEKIFTFLFTVYLSIIPLVVVDSIQNGYEYPKFIIFTSGSVFFFLVLFIFVISKEIKIKFSRAHTALLGLIGVMLFVDLRGVDPAVSLIGTNYRFQGFLTLVTGVMIFFSISLWPKIYPRSKHFFLTGLVISSLIIAVIAIFHFVAIHFLGKLEIPRFDERVVGTLGNPNFLGGYLAVIFPFLYLQNTKFSSVNLRITSQIKNIILSIFIIAIVATFSRSALFAIVISIISPIFVSRIKNKKVLFCIGLVLLLFFVCVGFLRGSMYDNRTLIWSEGIKAVVSRPIFGYGQENFEIIFPKDRFMKVDSAHNIFLEITVAGGIIALSLFIWCLILIWKKAHFDLKLMLLGFLITAFFNPISIAQWLLFWVIGGISASKE